MRKISASYIYTGNDTLLKNGIIIIDDNGTILEIIDTKGKVNEIPFLEHYNGIICPGFINTHCHLELSYLYKKFQKTDNLAGFISQMIEKKEISNIEESIIKADIEMQQNGIVACGDISNTENSFNVKSKSKILYYNFIEVFGLNESFSDKIIEKAKMIEANAGKMNAGKTSISPHASYSLSLKLLEQVKKNAEQTNEVISFHNQESKEETEIFANISNDLSVLLNNIGLTNNSFPITNKSSLESLISFLPRNNNLLLVHNVFTNAKDIKLAQKHLTNHFWVFCPKSNLFISNKLPNVLLFSDELNNICIGTDSLASNDTLSILEEIKILQKYFPQLSLVSLLKWATINGAKALNIDNTFGSFEKGKKPGINLIYNIDLQNFTLTNDTKIKVIA